MRETCKELQTASLRVFFIKPRRASYQDLPKASLLPVSTESWQKKERRCGTYKEAKDLSV
ncbi:MAG: hypothetical protein A2026_13820 [Deltaproteobacteria bacterium RBG_19FT_COMBO_46_12]|nr:MAG: hypothetical protein A2026_13820 [Deltaproteobacteria bacterium RBG_19FT_COMBO_46_12]